MKKIHLATIGQGEYPYYRIPGIVCSSKGTLLAYSEARSSWSDWDMNGTLLWRSTDCSETWEYLGLIAENKSDSKVSGGPSMLVDGDKIHLFYIDDIKRLLQKTSLDDGLTWSKEMDITYAVDAHRNRYDYTILSTALTHGGRLSNGRLIMPIWLARNEDKWAHRPSVVSTVYSDDSGKTWMMSDIIFGDDILINPSETTLCELSDGRVLLNMRNESEIGMRAIVTSEDNGKTFSPYEFDMRLVEPICCAGMAYKNNEIYFSHCTERGFKDSRRNLMVRYSNDDCKTWSKNILIEEYSGYSSLCIGADNRIYCFYESGRDENGYLTHLTLAIIEKSELR